MSMRNVFVGFMRDKLEWNEEEYEWDDMTEEMNLECKREQGLRERSVAQECVLGLMKTVSEEMNGENGRDTSSFLEEVNEVLSEMKHMNEMECSIKECWKEIEELLLCESEVRN